MPTAYIQAANPIWYVADLVGRPAGGGLLYSYSALNPNIPKPIYQDSDGQNPFTNPIIFDNNGQTELPFYFANDVAYYLVMQDFQGNVIWSLNNYTPPTGSGGGGTTINYQSIQNYVANNVYFRNSGSSASPILSGTVLAPSNHAGFTTPDITLIKANNTATDQVTFPAIPTSVTFGLDVTPENYLLYTCTVPASEGFKYLRFPLNLHVLSLQNISASVRFWANSIGGGTSTINVYIRQYMGQGGSPSSDIRTLVGTQSLTMNSWKAYPMQVNIPTIPGGTVLGTCGDDAVYLEFDLPTNALCSIGLTKLSFYLGNVSPVTSFDDYDQINAIIDSPRTGDIRTSFQATAPLGWIAMNDVKIGSASATVGAGGRANVDTFQLYSLIWNNVVDAFAPVSTGRGANAVADFTANKTLTLPLTLGRALASSGAGSGLTARVLGQNLGTELHAITVAEMPSHTHAITTYTTTNAVQGGQVGAIDQSASGVTGSRGGDTAMSLMQPTTFQNVFIKL